LADGALAAARDGTAQNGSARYVSLARFFAENALTETPGLATLVTTSADGLLAVPAERLSA
ncbi:MAG: hypothetical protein AAFO62_11030, partial [Pseudomonadota bacterium]